MALQLKLDPTGVETGAAKAKAALDGVKASATKAESAIDTMARNAAGDLNAIAPAAGRASGAMAVLKSESDRTGKGLSGAAAHSRMFGQQLSQIAQQGAVTGSYLGALAVQLPDMALGFGSVAIAASIVATVAMPLLITAFGGGESAAERLGDAMDEAASSVGAATEAQDEASKSILELSEKYGGAATAVKVYLETIAQSAKLTAMDDVQAQIDAIAGSVGLLYTTNKGNPFGWATGAAQDLGLTRDTAKDLQSAIEKAGKAEGYAAQVAAAADLNAKLFEIYGSLAAMPDEMRALATQTAIAGEQAADLAANAATVPGFFANARDALVSMVAAAPGGGWLSGAMGDADGLAAKLWNAFSAANATRLAMLQSNLSAPDANGRVVDLAALNAGGRGRGLPANVGGVDFGDAPLPTGGTRPAARPQDIDFGFTAPTAGSSGSSGGASAIDRTREAYDRLMESLDPVVARTNDLAEATATADAALAAHDITAAEHANAMDLIRQKYGETSNAMAELQDVGGNAIDSLIGGTKSLSGALRDMAKDLVLATVKAQLLKSVTGATAGDSLGGIIMKGILGGFGGGASVPLLDSGGRIPMGGTAMVGERGAELVRATAGGAVVTSRVNTERQMQSQQSSAQAVHVTVGVSVDDEGKMQAYVKKIGQAAAQSGAAQAVQTVRRSLGQWSNDLQRDGALA